MKETIAILGLVQSVFGMLLFLAKRPMHLSFKLLIFWLFIIFTFQFSVLLPFQVVDYFKPGIFPVLFLFGPLLYFYVSSLVIENFSLKQKHALHLLPLFLICVHRSLTNAVSISSSSASSENHAFLYNKIYYSLLIISLFIYWIYSIKLILVHRKNIPFYFSNYTQKNTLNWLIFVVLIFLVLIVTDLFLSSLRRVFGIDIFRVLSISANLTIFTFIMIFFGINQSVIFKAKNSYSEKINPEIPGKYKHSALSTKQVEEINQKVMSYLKTQKPFLNPEFSFQMLVEALEIPRHTLSQVINSGQNKNFYQLINEYRINEVKEKFGNREYNNFTLLGIAFECGFNSKSTFNRIFKEETGLTPSAYIKKIQGDFI